MWDNLGEGRGEHPDSWALTILHYCEGQNKPIQFLFIAFTLIDIFLKANAFQKLW